MDDVISSLRAFNRFYTRLIGALDARFLGSDATLAEARVLFELAQRETMLALNLQAELGMDAGFVSRILTRFETRGWIKRSRASEDARSRPIAIAAAGQAVLDEITERQRVLLAGMLAPLSTVARTDLVAALGMARAILSTDPGGTFTVRTFRSGDMGAIASRQSRLYAESHGWGRQLEVMAGEVTTAFLRDYKPGREQCWLAEIDGVMAGSVLLTDEGEGVGRLRLLYVEPFARGRGIGDALVRTCLSFARDAGFEAVVLWTHTVLDAARRIYARHGFCIVETAIHTAFGGPLQGETWRLSLEKPSENDSG